MSISRSNERARVALARADHVVAALPRDRARHVASRPACALRRVSLYLAVVAGDVGKQPVARVAGWQRKSVQRALAAVEDARDVPEFDAAIAQLEEDFHATAL